MADMTPEQRDAAMARMRQRGADSNAPGGRGGFGPDRNGPAAAPARNPSASGAGTIDALFAPLPRTETVGRVFVYTDKQLKPVRLRLGISDGQNTELIEGDLKEGDGVVTTVVLPGQTSTRPPDNAFPGFGPQRGPGGFGGGGGGRGR
jgi:hypothetical protein